MSTNEAQNEQVGYAAPPKAGQFKKGRSGNPRGRPKGSKNLSKLVETTFNEPVVVNENGQRKTITKVEAMLKQLSNKAAAGDARATQQMMTILRTLDETNETSQSQAITDEADRQVMQQIIARIRGIDPMTPDRQNNPADVMKSPENQNAAETADAPIGAGDTGASLVPEGAQQSKTKANTAGKEITVHE